MGNKTFAIIKPDAVKAGNTGKIYDRIIQAGFHIMSAKLLKLTEFSKLENRNIQKHETLKQK